MTGAAKTSDTILENANYPRVRGIYLRILRYAVHIVYHKKVVLLDQRIHARESLFLQQRLARFNTYMISPILQLRHPAQDSRLSCCDELLFSLLRLSRSRSQQQASLLPEIGVIGFFWDEAICPSRFQGSLCSLPSTIVFRVHPPFFELKDLRAIEKYSRAPASRSLPCQLRALLW